MAYVINVSKSNPLSWSAVSRGFETFPVGLKEHSRDYLGASGEVVIEAIKKNLDSGGNWAGAPFRANSPVTVAMKGSSKPLLASKEMRGLMKVVPMSAWRLMVGMSPKHSAGVDLASIHEKGARAGRNHKVEIPARPFVGPVAKSEKLKKQLDELGQDMTQDFVDRQFRA